MNHRISSLVIFTAGISLAAAGCEGVRDGDPDDTDTASDTYQTDTDTDTAPLDAGLGEDASADTDTDADTDIADASVIELDCSSCDGDGGTLEDMACAFDLCGADVVLGNEYKSLAPIASEYCIDCSLEDTYRAVPRFGVTTNDLAPKKNGTYAMMATGWALGPGHTESFTAVENGIADPWDSDETEPIYDAMEWRLFLKAPENARAFRFKYVFFSEEYDDFISTGYNDKFYVFLEAASTNDAMPTLINFTGCRDPNAYHDFVCGPDDIGCTEGDKYCYIAINSAFSDCCWFESCPGYDPATRTDISGTGYECASTSLTDGPSSGSSTGWLQTSWPIEENESFAITFHIHDTADGAYDSQVILDSFEFLADTDQGTIPVD